jgi:hypothetical protein
MSSLGQWIKRFLMDRAADRRRDDQIKSILHRLDQLEIRMTSAEQAVNEKLGVLIGVVVAEVASLRAGVADKDAALQAALAQLQALEDSEAADVARQVQAALDTDSAADTVRVQGYLDQLSQAVPADVPDVPVPDPGQPAEPPADSGVEVPDAPVEDPDVTEQP